jgi:hypothetical protein
MTGQTTERDITVAEAVAVLREAARANAEVQRVMRELDELPIRWR